jgi:hypothetical protein
MSIDGTGRKLVVVAVVLLLCGCAVAAFLILGADEDPPVKPEGKGTIMDAIRAEDGKRAQTLQKKMERLKHVMRTQKEQARVEEHEQAADGPRSDLDPREQSALKAAIGKCYDPDAIQRSLDEKRTSEYASEVIEMCDEIRRSETVDTPSGLVPMTNEMKEVVKRSSWLKSYALNLIKTQRPPDQEDAQWKKIGQINERYKNRFQSVIERYPFLGVELMEVP